MFRKLLFLGATVWLGKKGYDALIAAQTNVADFVDTSASPDALDSIGSANDGAPLNPVLDPDVADRLQEAKRQAAEVNDPA